MTCPHCNAPLGGDARFCGACGRASVLTASDPRLPAISDPMAAMIGQEIAGRFRIVAKLGEGGMGAVFRAEQISLKRTVALKLLRPGMTSPQLIRRFNAEAQAVAQLSHPNSVGIYDFGEHKGMLFIAMELVEGASLRDVVHREAPFSPARAVAIAMQVAASLGDAHARAIIHRDLKPDNVMLQVRGKQRDVVRVLDFGIAKLRDDANGMTQAGDVIGTPQYIAPEQAKGEAIDGRTDVYALGCMIYEMITGRLPFEGTSVIALLAKHVSEEVVPPAQRRPELKIPPGLDALVVQAMQKDPDRRPPTMEAFGEYLAQILSTLPPEPGRPTSPVSGQGAAQVTPYTSGGPIAQPSPPLFTAVGSSTPPSPYAGAPGAAPYVPVHATLATSGHAPPKRNKALLIAIIAGLAMCGVGVAVWATTRKPPGTTVPVSIRTPDPDPADPIHSAKPDPALPVPTNPIPADPTPADPTPATPPISPPEPSGWEPAPPPPVPTPNAGFDPSTQSPNLPAGARLIAPQGYAQHRTALADSLTDATRHIEITMLPLPDRGDIRALAGIVGKGYSLTVDHIGKVKSAGAERDAAWLGGTINGVALKMMMVVYDGPDYRLVTVGAEPLAAWDEDAALQFFAENVVVP